MVGGQGGAPSSVILESTGVGRSPGFGRGQRISLVEVGTDSMDDQERKKGGVKAATLGELRMALVQRITARGGGMMNTEWLSSKI